MNLLAEKIRDFVSLMLKDLWKALENNMKEKNNEVRPQ